MEAYTIIREIDSNSILIENLDDFVGKKVRISIEPFSFSQNEDKIRSLRGIFNKYADISKIKDEKKAWELAVKDKYGS
jgi:hypothetical protein